MVYFGPLVAEILSLVWGTPANFNGFRVLVHPTQAVDILSNISTAFGTLAIR